jgi:hypothetical protein
VDTQGLVLAVTVHPADVMDRDGVTRLLSPGHIKAAFPRLGHVWLDAAYTGKDKGQEWIEQHLGWTIQVVKPPPRRVLVAAHVEPTPRPAFTVLPRRWVVETTQVVCGPASASQDRSDRFGAKGFPEIMVHKQHPTSVWVLIQLVRATRFSWPKSVALYCPLPVLRAEVS